MTKHGLRSKQARLVWGLAAIAITLLMGSANAAQRPDLVGTIGDSGCQGWGIPVTIPHEVPVIGYDRSGVADITYESGDTGVFKYDGDSGGLWYYTMAGFSGDGWCGHPSLKTIQDLISNANRPSPPALDPSAVDNVVCAARQPLDVWPAWAADVGNRTAEIQAYGSVVLPCTEAGK